MGLLLWLACPLAGAAGGPAVGVVYPDIREPFRSVFMNIAKGIGDTLGEEPKLLPLDDSEGIAAVRGWAQGEDVRTIIALGSRGPMISDALAESFPVLVGAVHMSPELQEKKYSGISLSPDPSLLLERLRQFAPAVRRVTVVYHREREQWMIDQAADSARKLGIELNAVPVDRLQEAVNAYSVVLNEQRSGTDALWLSQDSAVLDEQAILPMILREAWNKKLIVFSSNPAHVRRGVLFALYPDNYDMGVSLGTMALGTLSDGAPAANPQGIRMLRDVAIALNIRTANHMGLKYSKGVLREIDLVFPLM